MDAIDLATLDDAPRNHPDPSVWTANLEALRVDQPDFARELEETTLPSHWRPVTALDGFPSYRVELPSEPPQWLAGTAAPKTRAAARLRKEHPSDQNPALPSIAAGAELSFLLERLSQRQAVFVFEQDPAQLAAVLRTVDLAQAVAAGRCILVPPKAEQGFLKELLERHPGLLPPTTIVALSTPDPKRLEFLRAICEVVARQVNETRNRRLAAVKPPVAAESSPQRSQARLAVLALGPSATSHRLAAQLADAADQLGWSACARATDGPRNVHALPHCEALADFSAELTICIAHPPRSLPRPPGKPVCQWHLRTGNVPGSLPPDDTIHLAATPRVADALRAAGVPARRLADFYWACATMHAKPPAGCLTAGSPPVRSSSVVIVGDLPDATASACGIEQPTHRQLWKQLHQTTTKAWETPEIRQPTTLLRDAERASGINLGERSLRERMVRIIEHVLIPTIVLETISQRLRRESYEVLTVGKGWHRCSSETLRPLAESLEHLPAHTAETPAMAAIFAGPLDPLSPALLHAAALGWPLLIHSPGKTSLTSQLGGILHPQQHYEPFAGFKDLHAALDAIRSDPAPFQRRCERLRDHLHMHHTYGQRLMVLAEELGFKWPCAAS